MPGHTNYSEHTLHLIEQARLAGYREGLKADRVPEPGWVTEVDIVEPPRTSSDGDTLWVEVRRQFPVRLVHPNDEGLIFDSPELNTPQGKQALALSKESTKGSKALLFIPSKDSLSLMDLNSFNRILEPIWVNGQRITSILMDAGLGRLVKTNERKSKPWPWEE